MFHGLDNTYLYSAYRIEAVYEDDQGTRKEGGGTGFFVQNIRGEMCFVTNRHVVDLGYTARKYFKFRPIGIALEGKAPDDAKHPNVAQKFILDDLVFSFSDRYENDIAVLRNLRSQWFGSQVIEWFIPYSLLATRTDFAEKLQVCDFVAFPGYPPWYDKQGSRPILRTGTIASDPRYDYSWTDEFKGECLAYEAFSFGGSSGSPVFAVQKGLRPGAGISFPGFRDLMMVGINAGHLPNTLGSHSGISYLYKSYSIADLINKPLVEVTV